MAIVFVVAESVPIMERRCNMALDILGALNRVLKLHSDEKLKELGDKGGEYYDLWVNYSPGKASDKEWKEIRRLLSDISGYSLWDIQSGKWRMADGTMTISMVAKDDLDNLKSHEGRYLLVKEAFKQDYVSCLSRIKIPF